MHDKLCKYFYGSDYHVTDASVNDETVVVSIESLKTKVECPLCGVESDSRHAPFTRLIQEVPFLSVGCELNVKAHSFKCRNPECERKV
ncbi:MAG: hypothetical protein LBT59_13525, partial [Clostridiales bacterium]|nr:hypothetical protein [Clostridiales bacterium]